MGALTASETAVLYSVQTEPKRNLWRQFTLMPEQEQRYPPIHKIWYAILQFLFGAALNILTRFHVEGNENIPKEGPLVLYVNHLSYIDSPAMFVALKGRHLHVLAADKYEKHWLFGR